MLASQVIESKVIGDSDDDDDDDDDGDDDDDENVHDWSARTRGVGK